MRPANVEDLTEACGLPVQLLDIRLVPPREFASSDALVIFASGIDESLGPRTRTIKTTNADCPVAAWLFDNHHSYLWNVAIAAAADILFPAHVTPVKYLAKWAPARIPPRVMPLCTMQWPRDLLTQLYDEARDVASSDRLSGNFAFYPISAKRNHFISEINRKWPDTGITFANSNYHGLSARERFLSWRRYKTSVSLPVQGDLSNRFFDALAAGQVPIVPRDIIDFDRVVSPAEQADLPVIRLESYSIEALRDAHDKAISAFDRGGAEQAVIRHRFVLNQHMLAHRIRAIVEQAHEALGLPLQPRRS